MPAVTTSYARGRRHEPVGQKPQSITHLAGLIKWLPPKVSLPAVAVDIEDGCYDHPVVILSPQAENGKVTMLLMTSFRGVDLETRHASSRRARAEYLPIEPSSPHPDNGILLRLRDGSPPTHKKSYVHAQRQLSFVLASLRHYRRQCVDIYLAADSYRELADYAKYESPAPHPRARAVSYSALLIPPPPPPPSSSSPVTPAPASSRRASTPLFSEPVSYASAAAPARGATAAPAAARTQQWLREQQDRHVAAVHAREERQALLSAGGGHGYDYSSYGPYGGHPAYASRSYGSAGAARSGVGAGAGAGASARDDEPFDWVGLGCLVLGVTALFAVGYWLSGMND